MKQLLKDLRNIALSLLLGGLLAFGVLAPVSAQGAAGSAKGAVCDGVNLGGGTCTANGGQLDKVIHAVISILSIIAGVAAVIMLIVGGTKYITSGGDASKIASAKNAIIYAIVGVVIVAASQFLVRFVLGKAPR